jgi:hypothetical protein
MNKDRIAETSFIGPFIIYLVEINEIKIYN